MPTDAAGGIEHLVCLRWVELPDLRWSRSVGLISLAEVGEAFSTEPVLLVR